MDLSGQRESGNVEDARGGGGKQKLAIGGGIVALLITLVAAYFGIDPRLAQQLAGGLQQQNQVEDGQGVDDGYDKFSRKVLGSTEDVWEKQFQKEYRKKYKPAGMKLFSDQVDSEGCGVAPSAVGPFYCPRSQKVFLDPTFFAELKGKLGGSDGQFSQAYVIAHEVGHHVQNLLGYSDMLDGPEYKREGANAGIRLELQADYLAGVWAHHAAEKLKLTERDVKEAITTAQAIGDNRIQKKSQGWVSPEKFTHGTDEQRTRWFLEGMKSGDASERALMRFFNRSTNPREL